MSAKVPQEVGDPGCALRPVCAECGVDDLTHGSARFCCPAHKTAFHNRMAARGRIIMPYLMAWIAGKGGGHAGTHPIAGRSLSELTLIVRDFLDEDRAAGRPPPIDYAESLFASGFRHMDRKRRSGACKVRREVG